MKFEKGTYNADRKQRRVKRLNKTSTIPEAEIEKFAEEYLDYCNLAYIRIPDSIYKFIFSQSFLPIGIKILIAKFIKGLPDLTILFKNGKYICVELKTNTGKLSKGQKDFRDIVGYNNFYVIRSVEDFQKIIDKKRMEFCK